MRGLILWTMLIGIFFLYTPVELTRVIVVDYEFLGRPVWQYMLEIAFFWTAYLIGMVIVYRKLKRRCQAINT